MRCDEFIYFHGFLSFSLLVMIKLLLLLLLLLILCQQSVSLKPLKSKQTSAVERNMIKSRKISQFITDNEIPLLSVYFVQGALGLSRLATSYFYKDELHLSPAEMAAIAGIVSIPWVIKPIYGFITDGMPLFGYKRKSYLVLSGIVGCLAWLAMGLVVTDSTGAIIANVIGSASIAVSDVVVDSLVVEKSRITTDSKNENEDRVLEKLESPSEKSLDRKPLLEAIDSLPTSESKAGDLQSLCWGAASVGGIFSAYFSGSLLQVITTRQIFMITSLFPLITCFTSLYLEETVVKGSVGRSAMTEFAVNLRSQLLQLKNTLLKPEIYLPVSFVFLWQSTPSPDSAMFFYSTTVLGFQPEFMGKVRLFSSIASLVGISLFRWKIKNYSTKNVIFWATIASAVLGLTPVMLVTHFNREIGIPDQLFSLTDAVVLTVLGQIAFMPTLVLASSLCPPGIEGTLFASLMSIYNGAGVLSSEIGAFLTSSLGVTDTNFDNLPLLIIICSLSSLLPLPFIRLLDQKKRE